ncbi:MAG: prolipoprotein diacylglyceryl transferase [Candidatus Kerfeldbacteria bacterium]|nr:prolipoprotein diacylglyceryl transferase [Candidatus Kerfeldbacteria bacterium]
MLPYFQWVQFSLGPLTIHIWGLMVALGIIAGFAVARYAARVRGLDQGVVADLAFWVILASFIGGRLVFVFSEFSYYVHHLLEIFKIWKGGMSISGGFIGAALAGWFVLHRRQLSFFEYADVCVFGLPLGMAIGRLGCFFIFDHPGTPTTFFLGQKYIDGIVRHNHGLYLSIDGLILAMIFFFLWLTRPQRNPGFYSIFFLFFYGITRFVLDFWRATDLPFSDTRFFHLTVAQYLSLVMVVFGAVLWYALYRNQSMHINGTHPKTIKKKKTI